MNLRFILHCNILLALACPLALHAQAAPAFAGILLEPGVVSTPASEYNYSESSDGTMRLFARSPKGFDGAQIYVSRREGGKWGAPAPISFADARFRDSDPFLAGDGKTLYFVSDRLPPGKAEKKDLDIWRSQLRNGVWLAPEHLGDVVNSEHNELGVELHGDALYFNSARPGGPGKMSIYLARASGNDFAAPVALPAPINGGAGQGDFTLSPDGQIAVFWSQRDGGVGVYAVRRAGALWAEPVKLGPPVLPPEGFVFTPAFAPDGKTLFFASTYKAGDAGALAPLYNGQANVYRVPVQLLRDALSR